MVSYQRHGLTDPIGTVRALGHIRSITPRFRLLVTQAGTGRDLAIRVPCGGVPRPARDRSGSGAVSVRCARDGPEGAAPTNCFVGNDVGAVLGSPDLPDHPTPCVPGEKAATGRTGRQKRNRGGLIGTRCEKGGPEGTAISSQPSPAPRRSHRCAAVRPGPAAGARDRPPSTARRTSRSIPLRFPNPHAHRRAGRVARE